MDNLIDFVPDIHFKRMKLLIIVQILLSAFTSLVNVAFSYVILFSYF